MKDSQTPPPTYGYYPEEKPFNLVSLWRTLWKGKMFILVLAMAGALGVGIYLIKHPAKYQAQAFFRSPSESDIQALNIRTIYTLNTDSAFAIFKHHLNSHTPRRIVFDEMGLGDRYEDNESADAAFYKFSKKIKVIAPKLEGGKWGNGSKKKGKHSGNFRLSMIGKDPQFIAKVVNRIAVLTERELIGEIVVNIKSRLYNRVAELKQEIEFLRIKASKQRQDEVERLESTNGLAKKKIQDRILVMRKIAKKKRLDQLTRLREAAEIAHNLGIKNPIAYKLKEISDASPYDSQIVTDITPDSDANQLYSRGYEALEAEINSLKARTIDDPYISGLHKLMGDLELLSYDRKITQLRTRKNDDSFIASLREKEIELLRLEGLEIDGKTTRLARLDQAAFPSYGYIGHKRYAIVIFGLGIGFVFGVFIVLLRDLFQKQQSELEGK